MEHKPVLAQEVAAWLAPLENQVMVDATVGLGGHALALLTQGPPSTKLIGLDRDASALALAKEKLAPYGERVQLFHENFSNLASCLAQAGHPKVDRILIDCGLSSWQLNDRGRGFSFQEKGPLDMRMDSNSARTAREIVGTASEKELTQLFKTYGEEPHSARIAQAIFHERKKMPLETTEALASVIDRAVFFLPYKSQVKVKARIFQALRIWVNDELAALEACLPQALEALQLHGRLSIITFHSLEDRLVKQQFRLRATQDFRLINKKVIVPRYQEILQNPRSRSAKLRVIKRCSLPVSC